MSGVIKWEGTYVGSSKFKHSGTVVASLTV